MYARNIKIIIDCYRSTGGDRRSQENQMISETNKTHVFRAMTSSVFTRTDARRTHEVIFVDDYAPPFHETRSIILVFLLFLLFLCQ
jgi:hypothetical protein